MAARARADASINQLFFGEFFKSSNEYRAPPFPVY